MTENHAARPILFSGDMVRAILDGRKTQTRKPVKPQPNRIWDDGRPWWNIGGLGGAPSCPYGRPGDLLWVRETWTGAGGGVWHRADCDRGPVCDVCQWPDGSPLEDTPWHPSIHMPRWACRLVLEVVRVRVERVQEITEEGALMEGSFLGRCPCSEMRRKPRVPIEAAFRQTGCYIHGVEFKTLWDSIYGKRPGFARDANPWVWAVEFKVAASTLGKAQAILEAA